MVVKGMMHAFGNATIVVCDAGAEEKEMLFPLAVRRDMIGAALLDADLMDANIVVVKNDPNDALWVKYVLDAVGNPADALVWSGDAHVERVFSQAGIAVKHIVPVPGISRDEMHTQIRSGDASWKKHVPDAVIDRAVDM
jgi:nicotinamide mononucleotide adenylyltransferase